MFVYVSPVLLSFKSREGTNFKIQQEVNIQAVKNYTIEI